LFKKNQTSKFVDRYSIVQKKIKLQKSLIDIRLFKKSQYPIPIINCQLSIIILLSAC